jgi:hypothetical protein
LKGKIVCKEGKRWKRKKIKIKVSFFWYAVPKQTYETPAPLSGVGGFCP